MTVSKEDFIAYEQVRQSGKTNMFDVGKVRDLSITRYDHFLSEKVVMEIMSNYSDLKNKYGK